MSDNSAPECSGLGDEAGVTKICFKNKKKKSLRQRRNSDEGDEDENTESTL